MHSALKGGNGATRPSYLSESVIFFGSYVQPITAVQIKNCSKSISVTKVATVKIRKELLTVVPPIKYCLKSEISIQLSSTRFTAVQIKNFSKSTSVIKVATYRRFPFHKGSHHMYHQINMFCCQQK